MSDERRRGRPPIDADGEPTPVHVKVSARDYDEAYREATKRDMSVPDLCRLGLRRLLDDLKRGPVEIRRGRI